MIVQQGCALISILTKVSITVSFAMSDDDTGISKRSFVQRMLVGEIPLESNLELFNNLLASWVLMRHCNQVQPHPIEAR